MSSSRERRRAGRFMDYAQLHKHGFSSAALSEHPEFDEYDEEEEEELLLDGLDEDLLADDVNLEDLKAKELQKKSELDEKAKKIDKAREIMDLRIKNKKQEMSLANAAKAATKQHSKSVARLREKLGQGQGRSFEDDLYSLLGHKTQKPSKERPGESESSSGAEGSSSTSSSEGSGFSLDSRGSRGKKKKSKKHHKSGLLAKSSKWVKRPQIYPHARLDNQYVMHETAYKDLTFGQFVAGELEIILGETMKKKDAWCRLEMLRKTAYRSLIFDWGRLLQVHAAIIRKIENGKAEWSDDFDQVERLILENPNVSMNLGASSRGKGKESKGRVKLSEINGDSIKTEKSWWCKEFQNNSCNKSSPHTKRIGSKIVNVKHFCATCFQERQVELGHPERSTACPYYSEEGTDRRH